MYCDSDVNNVSAYEDICETENVFATEDRLEMSYDLDRIQENKSEAMYDDAESEFFHRDFDSQCEEVFQRDDRFYSNVNVLCETTYNDDDIDNQSESSEQSAWSVCYSDRDSDDDSECFFQYEGDADMSDDEDCENGLSANDWCDEVKCPFSIYEKDIDDAILDGKLNVWSKSSKPRKKNVAHIPTITGINKRHKWYYQVQGQLHITQKELIN